MSQQEKTLYLHIGWSKTGTSAIQEQLDSQFETLKEKGILYSKTMQMNDKAHHQFALAFGGIVGYRSKYSVQEAIDVLDNEMTENNCSSVIISSELSPFYFNNPRFKEWIRKFECIKVISTIRPQSDLLISLFNQLIKDPHVRYNGSFFQMCISNFPKMNYFQHISRWAEFVGNSNIVIINYEDGIVKTFLNYFSLDVKDNNASQIINPSIPNYSLKLIQEKCAGVNDPNEYRKIRDTILSELDNPENKPERILATKGELQTIDSHFSHSNNLLSQRFLNKPKIFSDKEYNDIYVY
jgi:hypothetical protein